MEDLSNQTITCEICGEAAHSINKHLREVHPDYTIEAYKAEFKNAPIYSEYALHLAKMKKAENEEKEKAAKEKAAKEEVEESDEQSDGKVSINTAFKIRSNKTENGTAGVQKITIFNSQDFGEFSDFIPEIDDRYVFNPELLKDAVIGIEMNIPVYLWGNAGVGKSSLIEQICAVSNRPYFRVQHTANTEECHITGQILANEKGTYFEPGPLAIAMKNGLVYNADEYDFAHPSVTAVYQSVLEGKPLVIKEAPHEWRVVKPHENFRFLATGNTNGSGDETGLYAGTNLGNSANYSRFGITCYVDYMEKDMEISVLSKQTGVLKEIAGKFVEFAREVRKNFNSGKMSTTIGTRELLYAIKVGLAKGEDWGGGLKLAYINRLPELDAQIAKEFSQRYFG